MHPKDKVEPDEQGEPVYQISCKSCGAAYIRETVRFFKTRLGEHKEDVENAPKEQYAKSEKKRSQSTKNKSALTDHTTTGNHLIDWEGATVVDRGVTQKKRLVREAIWIRKTKAAINRVEGNCELPHL